MTKYLLIETRDPFESSDVSFCHDLASRLVAEGNQVTLYLVQNGISHFGNEGYRPAGCKPESNPRRST